LRCWLRLQHAFQTSGLPSALDTMFAASNAKDPKGSASSQQREEESAALIRAANDFDCSVLT